ncbi:MAG: cytidine deaminase [Ignavibacteriaceae bacterium]|nr:cytidine deaminase [Ignavibacteriaceae bacterium]
MEKLMQDYKTLAEAAAEAKTHSYSPYSKFRVGSAVLTDDGTLYKGTNIENASYGLAVCAERNAIFKAVYDGHKKIKAVAVTSDLEEYCPPCGACRQVMAEFCGPDSDIVLVKNNGETTVYKFKDILPLSFTQDFLQ